MSRQPACRSGGSPRESLLVDAFLYSLWLCFVDLEMRPIPKIRKIYTRREQLDIPKKQSPHHSYLRYRVHNDTNEDRCKRSLLSFLIYYFNSVENNGELVTCGQFTGPGPRLGGVGCGGTRRGYREGPSPGGENAVGPRPRANRKQL